MSRVKISISDPESFIYDYCYLIRNKVDIKAEQLILELNDDPSLTSKIDAIKQVQDEIVEKLRMFEISCKENLKSSKPSFDRELSQLDELNTRFKTICLELETDGSIADTKNVKCFEDWNKYTKTKLALRLVENGLRDLNIKIGFKLLSGRYVLFDDKLDDEFGVEKLSIFSVYDYKNENLETIDETLAEKIYLFEVDCFIKLIFNFII
jgi:hypothetical protein